MESSYGASIWTLSLWGEIVIKIVIMALLVFSGCINIQRDIDRTDSDYKGGK
jgi:hypothetical protein